MLNLSHRSRGWRNASLWAQVPHYLTVGPNPSAVSALVEVLDRGFGLHTSLEAVEAQVERFEEQVQEAMGESSEAATYIRNLEEQYDANVPQRAAPDEGGSAELPSAEDLLSDLEGFLRDQRSDDD